MKFGYARVSTRVQNLDAQLDVLVAAGCDKSVTEKVSGNGSKERPELDRLGRSLSSSWVSPKSCSKIRGRFPCLLSKI